MLRHIVLIRFKDGLSNADRTGYTAAVEALAASEEVRSFSAGLNVGSGPNHHDFAVVMDFDDMTAFRRYVGGAAHTAYVETWAKRCVAGLSAIQHDLPEP